MEFNSTTDDDSTFMSIGGVIDSIEGSNPMEWIRTQSRHLVPFVCFFGFVGNTMALILIRTNFWLKRLTSNVYLCTLSVSSCVFLATVIISWADTYMGIPLFSQTEQGCKCISVIAHLSDFVCVWMISLISCDRMIVLYRPRARRWICTRKFSRNITIGVLLFAMVLYSYLYMLAGLQIHTRMDGSQTHYCGLSEDVTWFGYLPDQHYFIFTLMDTALCTIIPAIFIIIVNTLSTYRYYQCMKVYESGVLRVRFVRCPTTEQQPEQLNYDTIQFFQEETTGRKYLLSSANSHIPTPQPQSSQSRVCGKLRSSDLQLSRTLIIVTSTFVLLNMPSYGMRIIAYLSGYASSNFNFVFYLTYLLYYLHHSVLFYMYIFWSPQMKKQLKPTAMRLLECYCLKTVPDFGHRSTSTQGIS